MIHRFKTETAARIGLVNAVVLHALCVWIENNETKDQRYLDERYWTYFDKYAIAGSLPFIPPKEVYSSIQWLLDNKYIATWESVYDENEGDSSWFDVTAKGYDVMQGSVEKGYPYWSDDGNAYFSNGAVMDGKQAQDLIFGERKN